MQPGETILELAAGAGDTGFAIIEWLGRGGRLISSDLSPATVEVARRAAAERALDSIESSVSTHGSRPGRGVSFEGGFHQAEAADPVPLPDAVHQGRDQLEWTDWS